MPLRHLIRGRLENAHWNGQHGGPGDVHLNCYSEIMGAGVRLEMIEKWMGSENTETPYGPLSRSVVLRENSPKPIHPQSLLLTLPCHSVSWSDFLIWYLMFHSCGLPGAMATSQPGDRVCRGGRLNPGGSSTSQSSFWLCRPGKAHCRKRCWNWL